MRANVCLALSLAGWLAGCDSPQQVETRAADEVVVGEVVAPTSQAVEVSATTLALDDAALDPDAGVMREEQSLTPRAEPAPDLVLHSQDLGRGHVEHDWLVATDADCQLARVELDLEVEGRPIGEVRLRSPSGVEDRLPLHVLTTYHFLRTWDWARLDALHALRGTSPRGTWTLEMRFEGAAYCGGSGPCSTGNESAPAYPNAELRVFCEPASRPAVEGHGVHTVVELPPPGPRRPGAAVRALLPVEGACVVEDLSVEVDYAERFSRSREFELVSPDGRILRTRASSPSSARLRRNVVARVPDAIGLQSAGLWELRAPRASGSVILNRVAMHITCAARAGAE